MAMIHSVPKDSTANDMLKGLATAAGAAYIGHLLFNGPSNAATPMNTPTKQLNNGNYLEKAFWTTAGLFGINWLYHKMHKNKATIITTSESTSLVKSTAKTGNDNPKNNDLSSSFRLFFDNYMENVKNAATDNCKKRVKKELQETAISIIQNFSELKSTSNNVCKTFIYWIDIGRITVDDDLLNAAFQSKNPQLLHFLLGYINEETCIQLYNSVKKSESKSLVNMIKFKIDNGLLKPIDNPIMVQFIPLKDVTLCDKLDELTLDEKAECWHNFITLPNQSEKLKTLFPELIDEYQLHNMLARTLASYPEYILSDWIRDYSTDFPIRLIEQLTLQKGKKQKQILSDEKIYIKSKIKDSNYGDDTSQYKRALKLMNPKKFTNLFPNVL